MYPPKYFAPKIVVKKEGQFNLWRIQCTVLGYNINNTKKESLYVTPSSQLSHPLPSNATK